MKNLILLLSVLLIAGCSESSHSSRSESREKDYTDGEFYFKKGVKVDNRSVGPHMYRVENDEAICYVMGSDGGLQCKFKNEVPK